MPVAASIDNMTISSFSRWEQSFRVFATIFTNFFPSCASELLQYSHLIHTMSLSFAWDNVYAYDHDFRLHMSCHPKKSWAIILQQAWTIRLKDKIGSGSNSNHAGKMQGLHSPNNRSKRDTCYRFNRGKCSFGQNCKLSTNA